MVEWSQVMTTFAGCRRSLYPLNAVRLITSPEHALPPQKVLASVDVREIDIGTDGPVTDAIFGQPERHAARLLPGRGVLRQRHQGDTVDRARRLARPRRVGEREMRRAEQRPSSAA